MRFFLTGPLRGLTRRQASDLLGKDGHVLTKSLSRADKIVLANAVAFQCIDESGELRPPLSDCRERVISERTFRRAIGLDLNAPAGGQYEIAEVAKVSGLRPALVEALCLADVLAPTGGFSFSDLTVSRKVAAWLKSGFDLPQVIQGFHANLGVDAGSITGELALLPFGAIALRKGSTISRSGQVELILDEPEIDPTELFDAAQIAEADGDLSTSTRLYELMLRLDGSDACSAFNLGNVLEASGKLAHAKVAYQKALAADPSCADAWCNLGFIAEREGDVAEAEHSYSQAIEIDPDQPTATWNLARLLCDQDRFAEALPHWERLSTISRADRTEALKWSKICRMMKDRQAAG